MIRVSLSAAAFLAVALGPAPAADPPKGDAPEAVSYYKDIRPIFQLHCQGCHQPAKPQGGYVMTEFADLFKKGDRGEPGVVAKHPDKSLLVEQIVAKDGKPPAMPRGKEPLPAADVEKVRRWIAQGAADDTPASARQAPVDADHPPVYNAPPVLSALDFSPDGSLLAVSGYHEILLHKADGSGLVARLIGVSERVESVAFSPDGKLLAMAGGSPGRFGEVQVWDVEKKKLKMSVNVSFDTLYGVSWSHDGTKLGFGCADNTVRAVDAASGEQILYQGSHTDWVMGTAWSKDSRFLASVSRDRSVRLTEVATQRFIDNITSITPGALKGGLQAIALNPVKSDKKVAVADKGIDTSERFYDELVIGGADGAPKVYKMHREKKRVIGDDSNKVRDYPAMPGRICSLAFSPDGGRFVAGSGLDGKGDVWVYNTADAKVVSKLPGPIGAVYAVAFRPDGKAVASAGFDGVVRLSDPDTGKVLKEFSPLPPTTTGAK